MLMLNSDIAVKVVDFLARARSAESGESPPEAGMFAEPVNVLSWMGSNSDPVRNSMPAATEDPDQIATDKDPAREGLDDIATEKDPAREDLDDIATGEDSAGEDAQLDDTIQRMRDFLSDNATFEWLKQRVQAVMSTGGSGELTAVSKKLSSILKQGFSAANDQNFKYTIDWDPLEFMQCNYIGYVDVASVISINSDGQACEACTVGEHVARVWPVTAAQFLEAVRSWWRHVSDGREEEPLRRMYDCRPYLTLD
jgi:hypothetical protein